MLDPAREREEAPGAELAAKGKQQDKSQHVLDDATPPGPPNKLPVTSWTGQHRVPHQRSQTPSRSTARWTASIRTIIP
jgi:hypothetical protein